MELQEIVNIVKERLPEKRFIHSLGVMERAEELASIYKVDVEKSKKVGILHDIAKMMTKEESMKYVKENNIEIDKIEKINVGLLHGKIGANIARKEFGFSEEMAEAIRIHTTGKENMDMLSKILYAADKTEKNRKFEEYDIEYERELSNKDIDEALIYMINEAIKINIKRGKLIHPDSILARNQLISVKNI